MKSLGNYITEYISKQSSSEYLNLAQDTTVEELVDMLKNYGYNFNKVAAQDYSQKYDKTAFKTLKKTNKSFFYANDTLNNLRTVWIYPGGEWIYRLFFTSDGKFQDAYQQKQFGKIYGYYTPDLIDELSKDINL